MQIVIIGASGRVGGQLVEYALRDQHSVTAFVRTPEKIKIVDKQLTVFQGNATNKEHIEQAIQGTELVISSLSTDGTTTLSESMPLIIQAMKAAGVKRIITIGTAGILQSRAQPELLRYQSTESKRKLTFAAEEHSQVYELLKQSGLNWTIVCPTYLHDGEGKGGYRVEQDYLPIDGSDISVIDTAEFTYSLVKSKEFIGCRVGIAY